MQEPLSEGKGGNLFKVAGLSIRLNRGSYSLQHWEERIREDTRGHFRSHISLWLFRIALLYCHFDLWAPGHLIELSALILLFSIHPRAIPKI